jgi:hypothetical protein
MPERQSAECVRQEGRPAKRMEDRTRFVDQLYSNTIREIQLTENTCPLILPRFLCHRNRVEL